MERTVVVDMSDYSELMELKGRVISFEAYVNTQKGNFLDKEVCSAILGLKIVEEVKNATD